jgi:DNA polymerase-3 subunit delta'
MLALRPAPVTAIEQALLARGAQPEAARLIAHLAGGRVGWALSTLEQPERLEQRTAALDLLDDLLSMDRAGRFRLSDDLGKDKLALIPLLELWLTYWRDLMLIASGAGIEVANIDRIAQLHQLAERISLQEAQQALRATQNLLETLHTNANVRLALDVLMLDYPGL